jgi:hypothetical protein
VVEIPKSLSTHLVTRVEAGTPNENVLMLPGPLSGWVQVGEIDPTRGAGWVVQGKKLTETSSHAALGKVPHFTDWETDIRYELVIFVSVS